jgi:FkbM family methyltransferase
LVGTRLINCWRYGPIDFIVKHPLTKDRKLASIVRFLAWQTESRLRKRAAVIDWIDGSKFFARNGETGLTGNIYTGLHEFVDMGFLLHFVRSEDLFVDVGANAGSYTVLACAARGARGYAIEPIPKTFDRLMKNIRLNQIENQVNCLNIGVGATHGTINFTSNRDVNNFALEPGVLQDDAIEVEVFPLDDVLAGETPTLIKVDVEGYETALLEGAKATFRNSSLKAVIMELDEAAASRYGYDVPHLVDKVIGFGLMPYSYDPIKRSLQRLSNPTSRNGLFIRDEAFVQERIRTAPLVAVLGRQF